MKIKRKKRKKKKLILTAFSSMTVSVKMGGMVSPMLMNPSSLAMLRDKSWNLNEEKY